MEKELEHSVTPVMRSREMKSRSHTERQVEKELEHSVTPVMRSREMKSRVTQGGRWRRNLSTQSHLS